MIWCQKLYWSPATTTMAGNDCNYFPVQSNLLLFRLVSITISLFKNKSVMNPADTRPISRVAMVAAVRYHKNPEEDYQPEDMVSDHNNRSWIKASAVWNAKRHQIPCVPQWICSHCQNIDKTGRLHRRPGISMAFSKVEGYSIGRRKTQCLHIPKYTSREATNTRLKNDTRCWSEKQNKHKTWAVTTVSSPDSHKDNFSMRLSAFELGIGNTWHLTMFS